MAATAILSLYSAGYLRTKAASDQLEEAARRRTAPPAENRPTLTAPPSVPAPATIPVAEDGPSVKRQAAPATVPKTANRPDRKATTTSRRAAAPVATAPEPQPVTAPMPAPETAAVATPPPPPPDGPTYKDGTYVGWGTSRHGDIQATVVIKDGRILSAVISECWTRYPCSRIEKLPPQVAERQSPEVDFVSGATQSTNAFYYAVVEALAKAK